ncbi:FISUMP domain-containing protein [Fibrobacter sp.]|uniref:FISUMP domain-containing protein n=1 Tax=Fibrobacter sp. TaxID=35828 RepID=UPI00388F798A
MTFSACGDDSSSSATSSDEDDVVVSSSSESSSSAKGKSSSSKAKAASSDSEDESSSSAEDESSSSKAKSSSSSAKAASSDSEDESSSSAEDESSSSKGKSSSSSAKAASSSSEAESSSSEDKTGSKYDAEKNTLTDFRDGKVYGTVVMGEGDKAQVWMAENLDFEYKVGGSGYGVFCNGDKSENCETYGRLYTWAAAMDSAAVLSDDGKGCSAEGCKAKGNVRGVCPEGWHLPSIDEWKNLLDFALEASGGNSQAAAFSLMSKDNWFYEGEVSLSGTDDFGFSLLGSGYFASGSYSIGYVANLWTSTLDEEGIGKFVAYMDGLVEASYESSGEGYENPEFEVPENEDSVTAYSVRCVMD